MAAINITFDDIFARCVVLSKYTGREQRDASGNSMFEQILIQTRDRDLIDQYAEEAAVELNKWLLPFFALDIDAATESPRAIGEGAEGERTTGEEGTTGEGTTGEGTSRAMTWTPDDTYAIPASFDHLIKQYIVNWSMGMWMRDKVPERAEYFQGVAERLGASLPAKIFRAKPNR